MPAFNYVLIKGNLVARPELSYTPSGKPVAKGRIGCTEYYLDKDKKPQTRALFFAFSVWGKQAEAMTERLNKGHEVIIQGRLSFDTWKDKESGQNHSKVYITATAVYFGRPPKEHPDQAQDAPSDQTDPPNIDDIDSPIPQ
jgi:single-strand DNA-binding protein